MCTKMNLFYEVIPVVVPRDLRDIDILLHVWNLACSSSPLQKGRTLGRLKLVVVVRRAVDISLVAWGVSQISSLLSNANGKPSKYIQTDKCANTSRNFQNSRPASSTSVKVRGRQDADSWKKRLEPLVALGLSVPQNARRRCFGE